MMTADPGWSPPDVDPHRANVARVYDYLLGGDHNFQADQDLARSMTAVEPNARAVARANRAFLGRAVRFLSGAGIRQYLDIGSGIPTQGNVHEVAQAAAPDARVVYADIDPVAIAHSRALLARNPGAEVLNADLRDPQRILDDELTRRLIDFRAPAGLLLVSVLPFVGSDDDPWSLVAALRDALAPGSYLVVSHGTNEGRPGMAQAAATVYNRSVSSSLHMRSAADILRFFDGFDLVDPGLTWVPAWRPDGTPADFADPAQSWLLAGVGVKP